MYDIKDRPGIAPGTDSSHIHRKYWFYVQNDLHILEEDVSCTKLPPEKPRGVLPIFLST